MNQLIKFETSTGQVELSPQIVRDFLVNGNGKVTDQEIMLFMKLCEYRKLNPFLKEAHLIKYGDNSPATMVTSYDVYKQRADENPKCQGYVDGIAVMTKDGDLKYRQGTFVLPNETLIGGWCDVYREDYKNPIKVEVNLVEYQQFNSKGELNKNWREKPAFMINKVAIAQGLRKAFPNDLKGLYIEEENAPITSVQEIIEAEIVETVTKSDVMTMLTQASNFENGKDIEKGKKVLHQALVELGFRELDVSYNDLQLSTLTKEEYTKTMEKINEIKSRQ